MTAANPAMGLGECCKLPQWDLAEPAAKRYLVHFRLKNDSSESNFKGTFTKNLFVFTLFTSNNATSLGDSIMWGPPFCGAFVWPNMLNMPKSASVWAAVTVLCTLYLIYFTNERPRQPTK